MFGIRRVRDTEAKLRLLEDVLDRGRLIDSIEQVRRMTAGEVRFEPTVDMRLAIGLDTNAVFRLSEPRYVDAADYLAARHEGPFVVPGQVIQEFWNNKLSAIQTQSDAIRRKYDALLDEVRKLTPNFGDFDERFQSVLAEFAEEFAYAFDPATGARIAGLLERIQGRALIPYVPRSRFAAIAVARFATKTPPGFRDTGHGDFFVWADYLLGLLRIRGRYPYDRAVLVTDDEKPDWSLRGQTHPILTAEVQSLIAVPFEIWSVAHLNECVRASI